MADQNLTGDPAVTTTGEGEGENLDPGGLPSGQTDPANFQLSDEFLAENVKDGRLMGRYNDIPSMMKGFQELEAKHANFVRDAKTIEGDAGKAAQEAADLAQSNQLKSDTITSMIPDFLAANMNLTPEMEAKAVEAGIDIRDLKLGAIEMRDRIGAAHSVVGGKQEYENMIAWGRENMDESQRAAFDKDVTSGMGEYAIKGLYSDFKNAGGVAPARITGSNAGTASMKGYATQGEMLQDRQYLSTRQGSQDKAARALHNKRMDLTSDAVIYNR